MARRNQIWIVLLVSLTLVQVAASVFIPRGPALTIISDSVQEFMLLAVTAAFLPKTKRSYSKTLQARLFWLLMTAGVTFWLAYQTMWSYFEVILRKDVPDPFAGDVVLFLHLVPMIAAVGVLPHLRSDERDERIRLLDFSLLITWWVFVYIYLVIPWQTVHVDEATYSDNFNQGYLTEKLVLLGLLAGLGYMSHGGWRRLYGQLLGATALYASSSYVANWAIAHKAYYSGSIYDIPLTASIAWIGMLPALADGYDLSPLETAKPVLGVWITRLSMLALLSLPGAAVLSALDPAQPPPVRTFRTSVSLITLVVMGVMVFERHHLLDRELSYFVKKSQQSLDDLKALQAQLIQSEKLASLGRLVGGAAHEINNPLTAMLGYSDLLCSSNLPPQEKEQAQIVGEQVRRTKTLVSSLLTFVRREPVRLNPVDLNSVLRTGLRMLPSQLQTQGIAVRMELDSSLPPVLADANQLLQVCLHLAGQIAVQLDPGMTSSLCVRTHRAGSLLQVDFFAEAPFLGKPTFDLVMSSEGNARPATLSLSACCHIVQEHGGRLLRPKNLTIPAFRVELAAAQPSANAPTNRAAAQSGV